MLPKASPSTLTDTKNMQLVSLNDHEWIFHWTSWESVLMECSLRWAILMFRWPFFGKFITEAVKEPWAAIEFGLGCRCHDRELLSTDNRRIKGINDLFYIDAGKPSLGMLNKVCIYDLILFCTRRLTKSKLLDRKLKNKEKKTSKTGWTSLTIQRFVILLHEGYLACSRIEDEERLSYWILIFLL